MPGVQEGGACGRALLGVPPNLEDPSTSTRDLVDWLCTPARSGLFISGTVLERIARDVGVPRGFGSRRRLLTLLLEGGARYRTVHLVLEAIQAVVERHRHFLGSDRWQQSTLVAAMLPWLERLNETSLLLNEVSGKLSQSKLEELVR